MEKEQALQSVSSLFLTIYKDYLPMHRDAKDLLLGGEDLGHHIFVPVGAVLGDDDRLCNVCEKYIQQQSRKEEKNPTGVEGFMTLTVTS